MNGLSLRRVPDNQPGAGIAVARLHYAADPERWEPAAVKRLRDTYTSNARWNREMEIQYEALEGELLYGAFNRERNLCEPFDVSDRDRWTIWMALDPHPRTAHAMCWEAFNKHGDRVVCGEFWPEFGTIYGPIDGVRWGVRDYAEAIQLFESDSTSKPAPFEWANGKRLWVYRRMMDTFGKAANSDEGEDYFETYRRLGTELTRVADRARRPADRVNLHFADALKGHDNLAKAQDAINRALMPQVDPGGHAVMPAMMVFNNCFETVDEFENVRFPKIKRKPDDDFGSDLSAKRELDEKPVTYQKHCLDCLHYIETARPRFAMPKIGGSGWKPIYPALGY